MATNTTWATCLLDEATAIVEAEWMACSRTKPCGSVRSLTCSPRCLRPGPARPASASPPPSVGGQAHRCQTIVAGGRRGDGPRRRYGLPSGLLRWPGVLLKGTVGQGR